MANDHHLASLTSEWFKEANAHKYSYHFDWLGRPIIQYPQDVLALQEIFWTVKPDLVIETGIAHGGSLIFSASMLELSAICGGPKDASVVGVDIDIRPHNRRAIEEHPLSRRITMIEGSSTSPDVVAQINELSQGKRSILVILDSNHTCDHVLAELHNYAPLVTPGSYCVVFDTVIERLPPEQSLNRPWGPGNGPLTAVGKFLNENPDFEIDSRIESKLGITVAPSGYLFKKIEACGNAPEIYLQKSIDSSAPSGINLEAIS